MKQEIVLFVGSNRLNTSMQRLDMSEGKSKVFGKELRFSIEKKGLGLDARKLFNLDVGEDQIVYFVYCNKEWFVRDGVKILSDGVKWVTVGDLVKHLNEAFFKEESEEEVEE